MPNKLTTFANKALGMDEKTIKESLLKGKRVTLEYKRSKSEVSKKIWKILKDIAALRFEQLVDDSRFDEARDFCKERIGRTDNRFVPQPWYERPHQPESRWAGTQPDSSRLRDTSRPLVESCY